MNLILNILNDVFQLLLIIQNKNSKLEYSYFLTVLCNLSFVELLAIFNFYMCWLFIM